MITNTNIVNKRLTINQHYADANLWAQVDLRWKIFSVTKLNVNNKHLFQSYERRTVSPIFIPIKV